MDRRCILANALMAIPMTLIFMALTAAVIAGVPPFRFTSMWGMPIRVGTILILSAMCIASPILAWRMYLIHSKNPRRMAARGLRIQRRWLRRAEARSNGVAHTSFEQWCVQHFTRDVGRTMRLAGKALFYVSLLSFVVVGALLYIIATGGRSAVPGWLLTLMFLFFPISNMQSFYGTYIFIFFTAFLGKRLTSLGAMIIKHGQGPLRADEFFLN